MNRILDEDLQFCKAIEPNENLENLRTRSLREKKQVIQREIIDKKRDLRKGIICDSSHRLLEQTIVEDISKMADPEAINQVQKYFNETGAYSLDTFYKTIELQRDFNRLRSENTALVFTYFQKQQKPIPEALTLDGIPGKKLLEVMGFMKSVKGGREILKTSFFEGKVDNPDIRFVVDTVTDSIIQYAILKIAKEKKLDLSPKGIYAIVISAIDTLEDKVKKQNSSLSLDIHLFKEYFLRDQKKATSIIETILEQVSGNNRSKEQIIQSSYSIFTSTLGWTIDTIKYSPKEQLETKIQSFQSIPSIAETLKMFGGDSGNDLNKMISILPRIGSILDTKEVVSYFDTILADDILFFLNNDVSPKSPLALEKATSLSQKLIVFFRDFVIKKLHLLEKIEQKEILDKIFSFSFMAPFRNSPIFKIADILIQDTETDHKEIMVITLNFAHEFLKKGDIEEKDFQYFISLLEVQTANMDQKKLNLIEGYLQQLLQSQNGGQKPNTETGVIKKFFQDTRSKAPSYLIWLLRPGKYQEINSISQYGFFTILRSVGKEKLVLLFRNMALEVRQGLTENIGKHSIDPKTLFQYENQFVKKLLSTLSLKMNNEKGNTKILSEKEVIHIVQEIIGDMYKIEKPPIPKERLASITQFVTQALIQDAAKSGNATNFVIDRLIVENDVDRELGKIDFFIQYLSKYVQSREGDAQKDFESFLESSGLSHLKEISIEGKNFVDICMFFATHISTYDLKLIFFKNKDIVNTVLFSKNPKVQLDAAIKLVFEFLKKTTLSKKVLETNPDFAKLFVAVRNNPVLQKSISSILSEGSQLFQIASHSKKFKKGSKEGKELEIKISNFSQDTFQFIHEYIKIFGRQGIDKLLQGKVYSNNFSTDAKKKVFFEKLKVAFTVSPILKEIAGNMIKADRGINIFALVGDFFDQGKSWLAEKGNMERLMFEYFKDLNNQEDFKKVIQSIFL